MGTLFDSQDRLIDGVDQKAVRLKLFSLAPPRRVKNRVQMEESPQWQLSEITVSVHDKRCHRRAVRPFRNQTKFFEAVGIVYHDTLVQEVVALNRYSVEKSCYRWFVG